MTLVVDPRHAGRLALLARETTGETLSLTETAWFLAGRCERPVRATVDGRPYRGTGFTSAGNDASGQPVMVFDRNGGVIDGRQGAGHTVYLDVPCGKCARCLSRRRALWVRRAQAECVRVETRRTWFCTLTANPETQLRWTGEAFRRLSDGGTTPQTLNEGEWYAERCKEAGRDLTKFVKRVRKNSGALLRCVWVFEKHDGHGPHAGLPHIHGLIHECSDTPVKYRLLKSEWKHGHAKFVLTDAHESERVVGYVMAYLMKSHTVRVRASRRYGDLNYRIRPKGIDLVSRPLEGAVTNEGRDPEGTLPEGH